MPTLKIDVPATGVHQLPFLTDPTILLKQSLPNLVVIEMTPVVAGSPTEARCRIPMLREGAVRLAVLLLQHAEAMGWELPKGTVSKSTLQ